MYRDKINDLLLFKNKHFIKVITGVRRCGKSTLLNLLGDNFKQEKNSNVIYINFEEYKYQYITDKELYELLKKQIKPKTYLLLDEIQRVEKWELVINSLFAEYNDIDIYITGSNAYLLSSELSTYLAGRYIEIKLLPLSFKEFVEFNKFEVNKKTFNLYIQYGGMPSLLNFYTKKESDVILDGITSSIIMKDIFERVQIKDAKTLKKIILFLSDNIGNITSINNIKNILNNETTRENKHATTVENYITALKNAFLFYEVDRYDVKGKDILKSQSKYYIVDVGIRNFLLGKNADNGRILENIVYLELIRRGYRVYIGKINNVEIDFVAEKDGITTYFQVCETMLGEETKERELKPLKIIKDNYDKVVLSMDEIFTGDNEGIKCKNIIEWLMEE
ncbi:MAG: ATP-binding protein [Rickettsiales bacterium]|nr:ATP-binding protein [Rickettsiales bacterium]